MALINENNVFNEMSDKFTDNDKAFLKHINKLYGNALSAKGLNLLDPIYANFFHYNKLSMRSNVDFPRVSRTCCFFTRPELNFSFENINSVPFFKWLYSKRIGKMIMASLTDPEYFIYGPAALNAMSSADINDINKIINEYSKAVKDADKKIANTDPNYNKDPTQKPANYQDATSAEAEQDDAAERAALESIDINALADSAQSIENLRNQINSVKGHYSNIITSDSKLYAVESKIGSVLGGSSTDPYGDRGYVKAMHDKGLYQAKNIFMENHNSENDRFLFTTPFIPLLQNCCTQITGAKDLNLETFTYEEDEFSSKQTVPTGMDEVWSSGNLSTSFEDIEYGPVSLMLMVWVIYIHYVSRGYITTTREHVTERILDYTCSIYVFVLGDDGRRIERWCKFTGCYPTSFPLSQQLDHNTTVDQEMLQKIQIAWNYNRYEPMNPEIFTDFNFLSETEWLVKLKDPYWESLYNRAANIKTSNFLDIHSGKHSEYEKMLLRSLNRPEGLWDVVKSNQRGMSGMLPTALIDGTDTGMINNYWGGYPYINKGTELVWVLPEYSTQQGIYKDEFMNNKHVNPEPSNGKTVIDPSKEKIKNNNKAGTSEVLNGGATQDVVSGRTDAGNIEKSHIPSKMNQAVFNENKKYEAMSNERRKAKDQAEYDKMKAEHMEEQKIVKHIDEVKKEMDKVSFEENKKMEEYAEKRRKETEERNAKIEKENAEREAEEKRKAEEAKKSYNEYLEKREKEIQEAEEKRKAEEEAERIEKNKYYVDENKKMEQMAEEYAAKKAEERRKAEEEKARLEAEKAKEAAELKRKAEAEEKRKAEERRKAEEEKARLEAEKAKKEAAELKRKAEEEAARKAKEENDRLLQIQFEQEVKETEPYLDEISNLNSDDINSKMDKIYENLSPYEEANIISIVKSIEFDLKDNELKDYIKFTKHGYPTKYDIRQLDVLINIKAKQIYLKSKGLI